MTRKIVSMQESYEDNKGLPQDPITVTLESEGKEYVAYMHRARYTRMAFEESLIGKVMTQELLDQYRALVEEEEQVDSQWRYND